jgi:pimeloyl-ACP methyl ester carboxylesterase
MLSRMPPKNILESSRASSSLLWKCVRTFVYAFEPSPSHFRGEGSNEGFSAQYARSNLQFIYQPGDLTACPGKVLILQSDDDPATKPGMRMALRNLYPQAQVHTFHQAGHTPFLSQPDEFYPLVRTFLHQL